MKKLILSSNFLLHNTIMRSVQIGEIIEIFLYLFNMNFNSI